MPKHNKMTVKYVLCKLINVYVALGKQSPVSICEVPVVWDLHTNLSHYVVRQ